MRYRRAMILSGVVLAASLPLAAQTAGTHTNILQSYNGPDVDHLYSSQTAEVQRVCCNSGWRFENAEFSVRTQPAPGLSPLIRFYSPARSDHLVTCSVDEIRRLRTDPSWQEELILGYVKDASGSHATQPDPGMIRIHRFWASSRSYNHYYSTNPTTPGNYSHEGTSEFFAWPRIPTDWRPDCGPTPGPTVTPTPTPPKAEDHVRITTADPCTSGTSTGSYVVVRNLHDERSILATITRFQPRQPTTSRRVLVPPLKTCKLECTAITDFIRYDACTACWDGDSGCPADEECPGLKPTIRPCRE